MATIIVFFGPMYSGKSTCARILTEILAEKSPHKVAVFNFAAPIKEMGAAIGINCYANKNSVHPEYKVSARQFMRALGDSLRELSIHPEYSFTTLVMKRKIQETSAKLILIDDLRYREEYNMLAKLGAIFVRIVRDSAPLDASHSSETEALAFKEHFVLINNSEKSEPLRELLRDLYKTITSSESPMSRPLSL
jgi:energy-coupling factor transporter ATP-binding protein EcfA2